MLTTIWLLIIGLNICTIVLGVVAIVLFLPEVGLKKAWRDFFSRSSGSSDNRIVITKIVAAVLRLVGFHWFHWQNLNAPRQRWTLAHFRAWTQHKGFGLGESRGRVELYVGLRMPRIGFAIEFDGGHDDAVVLGLHFIVLSLYIGLSSLWLNAIRRRAERRGGWMTQAMVIWEQWGPHLCILPAAKPFETNSRDPWWVQGIYVDLVERVFGRFELTQKIYQAEPTIIPMPEGCYAATAERVEGVWKRARLPWASHRRTHYRFEIPGGIPFAGKGENSWDCGDDATHGSSVPSETLEEAVGLVVAGVLTKRRKYGTASHLRDRKPVMARDQVVGSAEAAAALGSAS
ncbi:MAG TPA: hypothetical protein VK176_16330 [Phycisphaerales bacterium]|nr:hypothetical protein [Phycisphaerales bacterium]